MKIAAIQASPVFLDRRATTEKALALMREASANGAELCVFPEVFNFRVSHLGVSKIHFQIRPCGAADCFGRLP